MAESRFRRSAGGVSSLGFHMVWCPKYRRRPSGGRAATRCGELLDAIAAENGWLIVVIPDHMDVLTRARPSDTRAEVARKYMGRTARALRAESAFLRRTNVFRSPSSFAASAGYVSEATVRRYIQHEWGAVA